VTLITFFYPRIPYVTVNGKGDAMNDGTLKRILTWAGIAALVAIPVMVLMKKQKEEPAEGLMEDDSNIFAAELEE